MRDFLLVMQYVAIVLLVLESGYVFFKWKTRIQGYLFLICIATLTNSVGYLFAIQATTLNEYLLGLKMSYFGRVWVPFSLLFFVNALCKKKNNILIMGILSIMHLAVFIVVATCNYHSLYYKNMSLDTSGLFPCLGKENGIIHEVYNYIIIIYILYGLSILIATTLKEKSGIQRKRLALVLAAIVADSVFYMVEIWGNTVGFDDTVLGYAVSSVFMFIAIFKYSLLDMLKIASDYVIDEVSEGIVVINKKDEIEYFNKPAKEMFPQLGDYSMEIIENIRDSISTQAPLTLGEKIYTPEARDLINEGNVIGTVFVLVDDTQHYHYLKELKEQKELAEAANASKSAFLSIVSHEIRTPMNAVVGMTELLLRENDQLSDKQEKYLQNIKTSGSSLVMIVNDILDQSKIEAGKMEIVEDSYELRPMIDDVKMIIENRVESKPIKITCDIDESIPKKLIGDSLRIRQILINLMNNAVKFTDKGYINLSIKNTKIESGRMLLKFSVKDSGQGIRQEDLSKLGEAFAQVDTRKNHSKEGTGLGLSISRDFISMMGGQLEVASEYEKGSEFFFSIYQGICRGAKEKDEEGFKKQAWQEDIEFTAPNARVLVVDDNSLNLMIMEECMSLLDISADLASTGEEALEQVKNTRYDLIFMDYMMPGMDGVETTEKIREMSDEALANGNGELAEYFKAVPIIALTGDTSDETRDKFVRAGINDFTDKPVEMKKLKSKIISWIPENLINYSRE